MPHRSSPRVRALPALLVTLLIGLTAPAHRLVAQSLQTGSLEGRVTFGEGRAIANATVSVRQADGAYPRSTRTDGTGRFSLPFLLPGRYDVTVRQVGFREAQVRDVRVGVAEVTSIEVTLERARDTLPAVVVTEAVNASRPPLTTEVTFALSARERERLPAPRDANSLVRFTPGVRPGQLFGGSTNQANLYQLDGVTVNQPGVGGSFLLPNVDWLEDVRVIGLGAGAEYGNFQGGLVNLVTKSGSNTLQGSVRTFAEQRALNSAETEVALASELEDRYEVSGELRGPIVRDRLYFFVSGQEVRVRDRVPASFTDGGWLTPRTERRQQTYYGKLTWQATSSDLVHASIGVDNLARERVGLSPVVAPEATTRGESPSLFFQGNWQRVQSPTRQLELRVSGYAGRDDELPYGGDRPSVALLDAPDVPRFVNATYTRRNTPRSLGFNLMQSLRLPAGPAEHRVKVGVEGTIGTWRERRTRNGGLSWYTEAGAGFDPTDATTWQTIPSLGIYATADTGSSIDLDAGTFNGAVFLQDDIRVGARLSLSLGLRLNTWSGTITPGHSAVRAPNPVATPLRAPTFTAVRATGLDPRLGATYDLTGDRRTVLKGHWGRYHQNLFALMFDRAPGANIYTDLDYCDWNDPSGTNRPNPAQRYRPTEFDTQFTCFAGPTLFTEAAQTRRYEQPYVDQLVMGLERALGSGLRAELLYVRRTNRNVLSLVDDRRDRNWSPLSNVRVSDALGPVRDIDGNPVVLPTLWVRNDDLVERLRAGDVVPGYVASDTLRLWYEPSFALEANSAARRQFDQVQLVMAGQWARADVTAALAWTRLTGNFFAVSGYLDPSGNGNGPWVDVNTGINAQGRLNGFSPWDFKLRASGLLPKGFEGGAFLSIQAGDFWTPTLPIRRTLDYAIDTGIGVIPLDDALVRSATGQSILLETRGSRQLDLLATLDLRLQRPVDVAGRRLVFGVEVFNAFDNRSVTARSTSVLDDVGAIRARQAPRTIRLSAQLR